MAQNEKRNCVVQAGRRFLKAVGGDEKDGDARISLAEFEAAFKKVMSWSLKTFIYSIKAYYTCT